MDMGTLRKVIQLVGQKKLVLSEGELSTIVERVYSFVFRFYWV